MRLLDSHAIEHEADVVHALALTVTVGTHELSQRGARFALKVDHVAILLLDREVDNRNLAPAVRALAILLVTVVDGELQRGAGGGAESEGWDRLWRVRWRDTCGRV